jgi:hypothetical protein
MCFVSSYGAISVLLLYLFIALLLLVTLDTFAPRQLQVAALSLLSDRSFSLPGRTVRSL